MLQSLKDNLKNIGGWRTKRHLVVFNIDDYGNVRVNSREARDQIWRTGTRPENRMDRFDAMETREDLVQLFDVLNSVRDMHGRPAVFTAYTLVANPDFAKIQEQGKYVYEPLSTTFERLETDQPNAYSKTWKLWKEGIKNGWIYPQFHGREHLNLTLFDRLLNVRDPALLMNLQNKSMVSLKSNLPGIEIGKAYSLTTSLPLAQQLETHRLAIATGLDLFETTFGFRSETFTPPAQVIHPELYESLEVCGVRGIQKPLRCYRNLGNGVFRLEKNKTGRLPMQEHVTLVRNVVFEPSDKPPADGHVQLAMRQIETAFRWGKPAMISSHRVNFCGHIDRTHRESGLRELRTLLKAIRKRWSNVEFISADQLVKIIETSK